MGYNTLEQPDEIQADAAAVPKEMVKKAAEAARAHVEKYW